MLQSSSGLLRLFQHLLKLCRMLKSIAKYKTDLIERSDAHHRCFYEAVLCMFFFSSYSNLLLQIMYAFTRKAFPYNINEGFP